MAEDPKKKALALAAGVPGSYTDQSAGGAAVTTLSPEPPKVKPPEPVSPPTTPAAPHGPLTGSSLSSLNPANQQSLQSVSSYNPTSGPDPRDATYWANLAKLVSTSQQDYSSGQLAQTQADVNYNQQLGTMGTERQRNIRNLAESMIGSGLLRSGTHNRRQTDATADYLDALSGVQSSKTQEDQKRSATMNAILSSLGIDEMGLYADAASRYAQLQQEAADRQAAYEASHPPAAPPAPAYPGSASTPGGNFGWQTSVNKKKKK